MAETGPCSGVLPGHPGSQGDKGSQDVVDAEVVRRAGPAGHGTKAVSARARPHLSRPPSSPLTGRAFRPHSCGGVTILPGLQGSRGRRETPGIGTHLADARRATPPRPPGLLSQTGPRTGPGTAEGQGRGGPGARSERVGKETAALKTPMIQLETSLNKNKFICFKDLMIYKMYISLVIHFFSPHVSIKHYLNSLFCLPCLYL